MLFVPFGLADPRRLVRSRRAHLHDGVELRLAEVDRIETAEDKVYLDAGGAIPYDVLVIATGAALLPEETEGLTGPGWQERVFTFYTLDGAAALRDALRKFETGRVAVNMIDLPSSARSRRWSSVSWPTGISGSGASATVQIDYVTSLDGAFTKATCNRELSGLLADKGIEVTTEFNTGQVDGPGGRLVSWEHHHRRRVPRPRRRWPDHLHLGIAGPAARRASRSPIGSSASRKATLVRMDSQGWDQRYTGRELVWTSEPNRFLVQEADGLAPGRALDLACGEGRNAIWLAERGWRVTGVDFSKVGLEKAARSRTARGVHRRDWVPADLRHTGPSRAAFDLVIVFYLQVPAAERDADPGPRPPRSPPAARSCSSATTPGTSPRATAARRTLPASTPPRTSPATYREPACGSSEPNAWSDRSRHPRASGSRATPSCAHPDPKGQP